MKNSLKQNYLENLRGTKLNSKEFYNEVLSVKTIPKFNYSWATGIAIGKFLNGLKEGKILASICSGCESKQVPPMLFCHECFKPMVKMEKISDQGRINTYSLAYINTDATRRENPEIPIVIDFDETINTRRGEPSGILHKLDENSDLSKIKIGSRVKAVWKNENDRIGDITDILYFELMEEN